MDLSETDILYTFLTCFWLTQGTNNKQWKINKPEPTCKCCFPFFLSVSVIRQPLVSFPLTKILYQARINIPTQFVRTDLSKMVNTAPLWFMVVAAMWGGTNPLIKRGSKGIENIKEKTRIQQMLSEFKFLFFNWKYLIPFCINQSGSVVYYLTLATADLSLAVPITNSLTFIFTSISGTLLGEKPPSAETCLGMLLVVCGVSLCVYDKI